MVTRLQDGCEGVANVVVIFWLPRGVTYVPGSYDIPCIWVINMNNEPYQPVGLSDRTASNNF